MPRFVLLRHECPPTFGKPSHWDLMLERGGALMTWSFERLPASWRHALALSPTAGESDAVPAVKLADHRKEYLAYEGPVGGDRGSVSRCDRGNYRVVHESAARLCIELSGERMAGSLTLTPASDSNWVASLEVH